MKYISALSETDWIYFFLGRGGDVPGYNENGIYFLKFMANTCNLFDNFSFLFQHFIFIS